MDSKLGRRIAHRGKVDCIYIEKEKSPAGKGFRINGFTIDYTKCMFCALCVEPCPVDCITMEVLNETVDTWKWKYPVVPLHPAQVQS